MHSNNKELLKNGEQLKQELKLQLEKTEEMKKNFAEKSEQVTQSLLLLQMYMLISYFVTL